MSALGILPEVQKRRHSRIYFVIAFNLSGVLAQTEDITLGKRVKFRADFCASHCADNALYDVHTGA